MGWGFLIALIFVMLIFLTFLLGSALAGGATVFVIGAMRVSGQPRRVFIAAVIGSVIGFPTGLAAFGFVFMFFARIFEDGSNVLDPGTAGDSFMTLLILFGPFICSAICVGLGFQAGAWLARPRSRSKAQGKPRS